MATKLSKQLKREIEVDGKPYMVTLSPEGLKLTEKGKRLGKRADLEGHRRRRMPHLSSATECLRCKAAKAADGHDRQLHSCSRGCASAWGHGPVDGEARQQLGG